MNFKQLCTRRKASVGKLMANFTCTLHNENRLLKCGKVVQQLEYKKSNVSSTRALHMRASTEIIIYFLKQNLSNQKSHTRAGNPSHPITNMRDECMWDKGFLLMPFRNSLQFQKYGFFIVEIRWLRTESDLYLTVCTCCLISRLAWCCSRAFSCLCIAEYKQPRLFFTAANRF